LPEATAKAEKAKQLLAFRLGFAVLERRGLKPPVLEFPARVRQNGEIVNNLLKN